MDVDRKLIEIAIENNRLVQRGQIASLMTSRQWCRRVDAGEWAVVAPGVWCHRATVIDWKLQSRAGFLSLGAPCALHGRTAAAWWDLGEVVVTDVEFVVPRSRKSRTFPFVLHTTAHFAPRDFLTHDDVRVTTPTRTVIDLAMTGAEAGEIERVIDDAIRQRLTSLPTLRRRIDALCGKGVKGSAFLKALLLDSGGESFLERRFLELLRTAGLPRPLCQVVHHADGVQIARVDFQFQGTNIVVEVSGRLGHVSDRDRQRDAHRRNALQQAGHVVLEFTTADVLDGRTYVIKTITTELAKAGAR